MYYLTDTTLDNGCLRVLPGTHMRRHVLHDVLADQGEAHSDEVRDRSAEEEESRLAITEAVEGDARDVCVSAGDVVVGDARVLHGTRPNGSDARRTLVTLWFHPHYDSLPDRVTNDMIAISHQKYHSPIYDEGGWGGSDFAEAEFMLPDMKGHQILTAAQAHAEKDDHSLETYVRTPSLDRMAQTQ